MGIESRQQNSKSNYEVANKNVMAVQPRVLKQVFNGREDSINGWLSGPTEAEIDLRGAKLREKVENYLKTNQIKDATQLTEEDINEISEDLISVFPELAKHVQKDTEQT